jgi:hypothetical protein
MSNGEGRPEPFAPDSEHGRGRTLDAAINDAIKKKGASHGEVFEVKFFITVSNPHVGEYIVDLG